MNNFDWKAFDGGKLAYNAKTEEDAKAFLAECEKRGLRWFSGKAPTEHHFWHAHKENTCYGCEVLRLNRLIYSSSDWFREGGLAICSEPWNAPSESVVDMLRSITAEQSYQCALCKRIYGRTEPGCPDGVECGDVVGHLAEMVEDELRNAREESACGFLDEYAESLGLPKREPTEGFTEWLKRTHIPRPAPKALDADGVEIEAEDTVWDLENGWRWKVREMFRPDKRWIVRLDSEDGEISATFLAGKLTHREPDSLNHVLADMMEDNRMRGTSYIPRITALIERGAK